jgi:two-component sensor histidine kinase
MGLSAFSPKRPLWPGNTARESQSELAAELAIDLEAENAVLRAALASSEGAGQRRDLVAREMQHRMGNLLAVVEAIARQTFRKTDVAGLQSFSSRMFALAAAQKVLIESETHPATLAQVVHDGLAPHCPDGMRINISGPEITLDGRRAHALTLALHELATNAVKYGAFSTELGQVDVEWTVDNGQLDLVWRERGGPKVTAPAQRGFGSVLVTRNLSVAFGGTAELEFDPGGLVCRLNAAVV